MERTIPKKPKILGLDISVTATGVAVIHGRKLTSKTTKMISLGALGTKPDIVGRALRLWKKITEFAGDGITITCIEEPIIARQSLQSSRRLIELNYYVAAKLYESGIPFLYITTNQLKQVATGYGASEKEEIVASLRMEFPKLRVANDAEGDALSAAILGLTATRVKTKRDDIVVGNQAMTEIREKVVGNVLRGKNRVFMW